MNFVFGQTVELDSQGKVWDDPTYSSCAHWQWAVNNGTYKPPRGIDVNTIRCEDKSSGGGVTLRSININKDFRDKKPGQLELNNIGKIGDLKTYEAHVVTINGSTYHNLCVPANKPGGDCSSFETAWRNGYLYTCGGNDGPKLVPWHEGDNYKCYGSGGTIYIEITSKSAYAKKLTKKTDY